MKTTTDGIKETCFSNSFTLAVYVLTMSLFLLPNTWPRASAFQSPHHMSSKHSYLHPLPPSQPPCAFPSFLHFHIPVDPPSAFPVPPARTVATPSFVFLSLSLSLSSFFPTSFLFPCHLSTHTVICFFYPFPSIHPSIHPCTTPTLPPSIPLLSSIPNRQPARPSVPSSRPAAHRRRTSQVDEHGIYRTYSTYIHPESNPLYLSIYLPFA
ncbi:hypothetical protein IWX49DRAFT_179846 [Phyllosticta citricarpa]|uniref:Uncharacterized protein n=1 Tax=Phyllosticta citricarpa TaxID=55181 RepID=A0ABR1M246_9PEZI